jgi:hypothetical protein
MADTITRKRFTADEYQHMGRAGILSAKDRVELIDGQVLAMTPIGPRHNAAVSRATRALVMAAGEQAIVLPEGSVRLDLYSEPQPDLVLLRPRADFYASRLAGPDDILLVIEIADSSIAFDRDVKARVYAEAGVVEYWIADLTANVVRRCSTPERGRYLRVEESTRGESIAPGLLPSCLIPVDELLTD